MFSRPFALLLCFVFFVFNPYGLNAQNEGETEEEPGRWNFIPFGLPFASSDVGNGALANAIITGKTRDGTGDNTIIVATAATDTGLRVVIANGKFRRAGGWTFEAQAGQFLNPQEFYFSRSNFQDMQKIARIQDGREAVTDNLPESPTILRGRSVSLNRLYLDRYVRDGDPRIDSDEINPGREVLRQRQNRHFQYGLKRNLGQFAVQKTLGDSHWALGAGLRGTHVRTDSYRGDKEQGDFFPNSPTLLDLERPVGYDSTRRSVFANKARVELEYLSLPEERQGHPNRGLRSGVRYESSGRGTGSHYTFDRVLLYHHHYIELFPSYFQPGGREMVLAYRLIGTQTFGDIPFFEEKGLGGTLLRGYPANQFTDRVQVAASLEVRYTAIPARRPGGVAFGVVAFADTGRVAPTPRQIDSYGWHRAGGAGVNIIFGNRFAIELLGGASTYQRFFTLQIGHTFDFRG